MGMKKRKADASAEVQAKGTKSESTTQRDPAPKKQKHSHDKSKAQNEKKQDKSDVNGVGKKESSSFVSALREEEPSFPRGGASVLTPLEHKQIRAQATKDVLFEQGKPSAKKGSPESGEEGEGGGQEASASLGKKSKKKGKKSKAGHNEGTEVSAEKGLKVQGLTPQSIVSGSIVLGQVVRVGQNDITLSLPNNLMGFVPISAISSYLTDKLEKIAATEDEETGDDEDVKGAKADNVDIHDYVYVGQYFRAYVTSSFDKITTAEGTKEKRRIELSLRPNQTNTGLEADNLVDNTMVQASVASIEDHGLVMDLGLSNESVKGFVSSKEIDRERSYEDIREGAVLLCRVLGRNESGRILKLSADMEKTGNTKKLPCLFTGPSIDVFLPGTAAEILVDQVSTSTLTGKIMGMLDVTADVVHSGSVSHKGELTKRYQSGDKIKCRVICTFPTLEPRRVGVSLLDHVVGLTKAKSMKDQAKREPTEQIPLSTTIENAKVTRIEPDRGLFLDVGAGHVPAFVHISRVADSKTESLSSSIGAYKSGSVHKTRILDYSPMDGLFLASMQPKIIAQPFLRIADVPVGQVVKGRIERLIVGASGMSGLIVNIAEGVSGLVSENHLTDVQLSHPERKFREGQKVTARVLSVSPDTGRFRLTLKKSLVNSEAPVWKSYEEIDTGTKSPGVIVSVQQFGAIVQFYGDVRGLLPLREMSEAFIKDPTQHFRVGQVVNVRVLSVDPSRSKLTVSCRDGATEEQNALDMKDLHLGSIISGEVIAKLEDNISVELKGPLLTADLPLNQLSDGSEKKSDSLFKNIRVGQSLNDLVVWNKQVRNRVVILSKRPSIVDAAQQRKLITKFEDVIDGHSYSGFIRRLLPTGVVVQFAGGVTGFLPKAHLPQDTLAKPDFGLRLSQSITATAFEIDPERQKFLLSTRPRDQGVQKHEPSEKSTQSHDIVNPIDSVSTSIDAFSFGKVTKARITSIKPTQLNVELADNVQGRLDVSAMFDSWSDLKDRKQPLVSFKKKQIMDVRVLGVHDARNHRFLPISHRNAKNPVFELTAKPSHVASSDLEILTLDKVKVGSNWIGFINNIAEDHVWVNLSPSVRGRIRNIDLSDNVALLKDIGEHFPIGSALKVNVTAVDLAKGRLDLSARISQSSAPVTYENLTAGSVLPGRITKIMDRGVMVQLSPNVSGFVFLTDIDDDFERVNLSNLSKDEIVRVSAKEVDAENKRVALSMRPSKILSSSLPVTDPEVTTVSQLKVNAIVRGFIHNIADVGIFVSLGTNVKAHVRVSDLSDAYIKNWKANFTVNQLVKGKIIAVDPLLNYVSLSLKSSVIDKDYVPPLAFNDLEVGQVVTGKVRKVEDFGVFIIVDNSSNVSGLCHRSQIADQPVKDIKTLFDEGDNVKAKVLKIDATRRRVNFGLKASYFRDESAEEDSDAVMESDEEVGLQLKSDSEDEEMVDAEGEDAGGVVIDGSGASEEEQDDVDEAEEEGDPTGMNGVAINGGLETNGFDWTANIFDTEQTRDGSESEAPGEKPSKKKRHHKASIKPADMTGTLDASGPQSPSDFERLLLTQPSSSFLWISYMAFHLRLSEVDRARELAERALRNIEITEQGEKLNVWIAWLNLENTYGSQEQVDDVFQRASEVNDRKEIGQKLISIYIQSGKTDQALNLYESLLSKPPTTPALWYNYLSFLMNAGRNPHLARSTLPRALQSLPEHTHVQLTSQFACLEFRSDSGDPERGRTIFEGLLDNWPKRWDLWGVWLDMELVAAASAGAEDSKANAGASEANDRVRALFNRILKVKGLKPRKASRFFKRWIMWEEHLPATKERQKRVDAVKTKAADFVRQHGTSKDA